MLVSTTVPNHVYEDSPFVSHYTLDAESGADAAVGSEEVDQAKLQSGAELPWYP